MWYDLVRKKDRPKAANSQKVFGPCTDYRDIRKAAYQEYLIATDFNIARLPKSLSVNTGAALGVAFVSAFLALGISLGFDFSTVIRGPSGPDLHKIITAIDPETVPEDVRDETFHAVEDDERPQAREWFAIWGGRLIHVQVRLALTEPSLLKYWLIRDSTRQVDWSARRRSRRCCPTWSTAV